MKIMSAVHKLLFLKIADLCNLDTKICKKNLRSYESKRNSLNTINLG